MRLVAALLACAAAVCASGAARADEGQQALFGAAFSPSLVLRTGPDLTALGPVVAAGDGTLVRYTPGLGLTRWSAGGFASFGRAGLAHVNSVRLSTAAFDPLPGATLMRPGAGASTAPQAFDLTYVRDWPSVFSLNTGRLSLDISPHAGLGVSTGGAQSAEAGALVRFGARLENRVLQAMGMRGLGDRSRWYLYAGASGRAVGLNLIRNDDGVRHDDVGGGDGFVREAQAGLGVSRGALHALLGYTHEQVIMRALGQLSRSDDRVGLTLAIR